ncbi:MAG: DUF11 domain-containing protein [Saprospiraceae bacterium]|nr:DUF11 domain-containing protein [Saprospiraceae bacterium]
MRKRHFLHTCIDLEPKSIIPLLLWVSLSGLLSLGQLHGQCNPVSGQISGSVFMDKNYNGSKDPLDHGIPFVQLSAYSASGQLAASALTDLNGSFTLTGLSDGLMYSVEIHKPNYLEHTRVGDHHIGDVRFLQAPACESHFGLYKPVDYNLTSNPNIAVTNFVGGADLQSNHDVRTIVGLEQNFNSISPTQKLAQKNQTGAIYGLAYNRTFQKLYASSFVKYGAVLGPLGTGGIYLLDRSSNTVSPFVDLASFGIQTGSVNGLSAVDCNYGNLVGKVGLGNMDISDDDRYLFVSNLYNKSLVVLPTENPSAGNVIEIKIPDPGCNAGDYVVSAIKYYNGFVYVGVTCTAETSQNESDCSFTVYEFSLVTRIFTPILYSNFIKAYWPKDQRDFKGISHWLTDLDFNRFGEMVLGISDRKGHAYCLGLERLTNQRGDILMAWKSPSGWVLEKGGYVNGRAGSGLNHLEGPGFGEFFGQDYWIVGPSLHQEISNGTLAAMSSRDEVINVVFDPLYESFAGGLQRYSAVDGKLLGATQLYNATTSVFGKASGLGDVEIMNEAVPIEIGNLVWHDKNSNGVQDADERGLAGIRISLYDHNCIRVASVLTSSTGTYLFDETNVDLNQDGNPDPLQYGNTYYIVLDDTRYLSFNNSMIVGKDTLSLTHTDRQTGGLQDVRDNDAILGTESMCQQFIGMPVAKIVIGNNGQNVFNVDIGLMPSTDTSTTPPIVDILDLALIKKTKSLGSLKKGDLVEFEIEIHNQGTLEVAEYEVVDYIPAGMVFLASDNPGWSLNQEIASFRNTAPIQQGDVQYHSIRLRLNDENQIGQIVNFAEISEMRNEKGELLSDFDSTPDRINGNDLGGQPNTSLDNALNDPDDEDDHDGEALYVHDLALVKILPQASGYKPGDVIEFNLMVRNQGNTTIPEFELVDYIPSGLEFVVASNPNWKLEADHALYLNKTGIVPGETKSIPISLRIRNNATVASMINTAEISAMRDQNGIDLMDRDSKADRNPNNDAGAMIGTSTQNYFDGDGINDEDDHDRSGPELADLALVKIAQIADPVKINQMVTYKLRIKNQGTIPVGSYSVVDFIPNGLEFVANQNPGWIYSNHQAHFTDPITLEAGQVRELSIKLKVISSNPADLINEAEIYEFKDINKSILKDWDSTPDQISGNDDFVFLSSSQKSLIEDVDGDEDDSDSEALPVMDMALILTTTQSTPVKMNQDVSFQIRVCNQGNMISSKVEFVYYLPAGLEISPNDNNGWMLKAGKLVNAISQNILPGECATREIVMRVKSNANANNLLARAEIVKIWDAVQKDVSLYDIDSNPDEIADNDPGGVFGTATDNILNGDGINDEDDSDPEGLMIMDVSLVKSNVSPNSLKYKGTVRFEMSVNNIGNVPVNHVRITDYIPNGFAVSPESISAGWSVSGNLARYTMSSILLPGQSRSIEIVLLDLGTATLNDLKNWAEISRMENANGVDWSAFDFDSTPDEILDNDAQDEDDIDVAPIPVFDLALRKTIPNKSLVYGDGDDVTFHIRVYNQGNIASQLTGLVDYLDEHFEFDPLVNPGWSLDQDGKLYYTISNPILPGQNTLVPITLTIKLGSDGVMVPNFAEIIWAEDATGRPLLDYDSTPDNVSDNDLFQENPDLTNHGDVDEDDHDGTDTNPNNFDLTLSKSVNARVVQRGEEIEWVITVTNEGSTIASELVVVDFIPEATTLVSTQDWLPSAANPHPRKFYYTFSEKNGRLPQGGLKFGESVQAAIRLKVDDDHAPGPIINRAEIYSATNPFVLDDDDSTADDDPENDGLEDYMAFIQKVGGTNPETGEVLGIEDDADISGVYLLEILNEDCICLNNATTPGNGQFSTILTLESRTGEIWFIREVNGLYHNSSPAPPAAPTPFVTGIGGFILDELSVNGPITVFTMQGYHIDGVGFDIILENQFGDKVSLGNVRCNYDSPILREAQTNVCSGSNVRYSVDFRQGSTYQWTLSSGGVITSGTNSHAVAVSWNGAINSTHTLSIKEYHPDLCLRPLDLGVTIGSVGGSVSCLGDIQVSLGFNCEAKVTPQMLLVGGPYDYNSYSVMVINKDGSLVPNATVNYSHVGKVLTAKLINVCNGNSCWATVTVEDKWRPEIICLNDTIDCTRMKSHLGPLTYDYCDPNPTKILLDEKIENTQCNPLYSRIVTRYYQAKDASGNLSKICTAQYFLKRIILDSIIFPDSLTVLKGNPLLCNKFPTDSTGKPTPEITGYPYYLGAPIWPNLDHKYCDYSAVYEDFDIPTGKKCTKKFLRVWRFVIWYCTTFEQVVYSQLIEIVDDEAPVLECPYDIEAITGSYHCESSVWIPMPKVSDNCSNEISIDLVYPGGFIKDFTARYINLPYGNHILKFRAYDLCHNVDSCEFRVNVVDHTPPTAICDRETAISLDRFGMADIPAHVFDDGSYDNCLIHSLKVRRMDEGGPCQFKDTQLRDSVRFCCADIGNLVTVLFVATDYHGNSNTCMVQVEVQDKTIPHIYCPHDITISCHDHFDRNDLSQFGTATVSDNCDVTFTEIDSFHIDQCREGYIDRIFIAGNQFGQDVCVQRIYIVNDDPFEEADIIWPKDFDTTSCAQDILDPGTLPHGLGYPILNEDICDLTGISYEDHVFRIINGNDACYKVLRRWKVTNWCRFYDRAGNPIIYDHEQIIKIHNTEAPYFTGDCEDKIFEIRDTNCLGADVILTIEGGDDCTPADLLRQEYHIDLYSNGTFDHNHVGVGSVINASGFYPLGEHRIVYVFEDLCGNKSVCESKFTIVNKKAPVAYCLKGVSVGLVPWDLNGDGRIDGEFVEVWATDLDRGSYHPCGYDLTYSFGRDTTVKSIRYDCDSIGVRVVELCVTATNGEQSCCETFVEVQDNNTVDFCNCLRKPNNLTVSDCEQRTSPVDLGSFPELGNCNCTDVTITHSDKIVPGPVGSCFVIERTWDAKFNCPGNDNEFEFVQRIIVTTSLKESDITWPKDSVIVDNCLGSVDTIYVGETPRVCDFKGNVMVMYTDREISNTGNERIVERIWTVFSKCVTSGSQTFSFRQILIVINATGVRYNVPPDVTLTDCHASVLPGDVNGFPRVNCPCPNVVHTYTDSIAQGGAPNVCYTIYRRWRSVYNCPPDVVGTFTGTQRIFVSIDLRLQDIMWGSDSILVDDCSGKYDTGKVNQVPKLLKDFCGYVTITYVDTIKQDNDTCRLIQRTWTVNNECRTGAQAQTYRRNQIIKVLFPDGPRLILPPNITVNDCAKPLLPDSLNGYPTIECGCDSLQISYDDDTIRVNAEICFTIERTWTVGVRCRPLVDTVLTGVQIITLDVNLNPADIIWPQDSFTSYTCIPTLDPKIVGEPSLRRNYCGLVKFNFVDTIRPGNPCRTVERTWRATNDCSASQVFSFKQFIITKNQDAPSITCPPDVTVSAGMDQCGAMVNLGNPSLNNDCNSGVTFMNNAPAVFPVGKTNVTFTATDSCGNTATCITMVTVIENVPPDIICPQDLTIGCDVNTDDLDDFGVPDVSDNCPGVMVEDSVSRNQDDCGIGTITRYFTATDASGNTATCSQLIVIENSNPLDSIEIQWPPSPITVDECESIDTSSTGVPFVSDTSISCYKLRITFQDSNLCKFRAGCEIERYWEVYDTCSDQTFSFTQLIIRDDQNAPIINVPFMDTILYANDTSCNNFVSLVATIDGCDAQFVVLTNDSPFGGNGMDDASGLYPVGTTVVTFTAEDPCCNVATKQVTITVKDSIAPEVTCRKVIKHITDSSLCVTFGASEFIAFLDDNCTDTAMIMVYFDPNDPMDTTHIACCDSIPTGFHYLGPINVYFKDEAGNVTICETLLQVFDDDSLCPPMTLRDATVQGIVSSRKDKKLPGISVQLNNGIDGTQATANTGYYAFRNMPLGGSYNTQPHHDLNHHEGVSTFDLVQIQKHILGVKSFDNPYKYIAADVNKSKSVTVSDIAEIRKLILGIQDRFAKNTSWRFVLADYLWDDIENPLLEEFPESYMIQSLDKNYTLNFTGVKIGDVDDSNLKGNFDSDAKSRTQGKITLTSKDKLLAAGEEYSFELDLKQWQSLEGLQAAIAVSNLNAQIIGIETPANSALQSESYSLLDPYEGLIRLSWVNTENMADEWKMKVTIRSMKRQYLSEILYVDYQAMSAEAYSVDGSWKNVMIEFDNENPVNSNAAVRLYQNIPNPFNLNTRIPFEINKDQAIVFELLDINGKTIHQRKLRLHAGYHEIELHKNLFGSSGVYYYLIQTDSGNYMRRMVLID